MLAEEVIDDPIQKKKSIKRNDLIITIGWVLFILFCTYFLLSYFKVIKFSVYKEDKCYISQELICFNYEASYKGYVKLYVQNLGDQSLRDIKYLLYSDSCVELNNGSMHKLDEIGSRAVINESEATFNCTFERANWFDADIVLEYKQGDSDAIQTTQGRISVKIEEK